jgi:hypothetical protein
MIEYFVLAVMMNAVYAARHALKSIFFVVIMLLGQLNAKKVSQLLNTAV